MSIGRSDFLPVIGDTLVGTGNITHSHRGFKYTVITTKDDYFEMKETPYSFNEKELKEGFNERG